jgi:hypothetical protein
MTVHGERISERRIKFYGDGDTEAYFSEQINVTKKYHYGNDTVFLTGVPEEDRRHLANLTDDSFYEIPSNDFKEKYYRVHRENSESKMPAFYIIKNSLFINTGIT